MMLQNSTLRLLPAEPSLAADLADYYSRNRSFHQTFDPVRVEEFYTEAYQYKLL